MSSDEAALVKTPHTSIFMILLLPFGISQGYVAVTLTYLLGSHGMPALAVASLTALSVFPQTWKFVWAPVVDISLTPKLWYVIGVLAVAVAIVAMSLIPEPIKAMGVLAVLVVVSSIASSFTSMACETFMANLRSTEQGKASGWAQAGNFAGVGVGGGVGLYLAEHIHAQWVSGAALGLACVLCSVPLLWLVGQVRTHIRTTLADTIVVVGYDVWSVARSRAGILVLILMLLPLGSGGAASTMTSKANEWKVGADLVASVGGVLSGLVAAAAAVIGGYLITRIDRRTAYCVLGAAVAIVLIPTALAPRTPAIWVASSLAYTAILAVCYTAYSAVVLEAIGQGAAATKFNLLSSASNIPVWYMPIVDGYLHDHWGTSAMFFGESALGVLAAILFGILVISTRRWRDAPDDIRPLDFPV